MKIKFTKNLFTGSRSYAVGEVAELPQEQAATILKQGFAEAVKDEPQLETADKPPVIETATKTKKVIS